MTVQELVQQLLWFEVPYDTINGKVDWDISRSEHFPGVSGAAYWAWQYTVARGDDSSNTISTDWVATAQGACSPLLHIKLLQTHLTLKFHLHKK